MMGYDNMYKLSDYYLGKRSFSQKVLTYLL